MKYKLDDIDKRKAFKVPEGYFEDLPMKIQQRISENPQKQPSGAPAWALAMAASVALVIAFIFLFQSDQSSTEKLLADIPQEELIAYLDLLEIDEYDLAHVMGDDADELLLEDTNVLDGIDLGEDAIEDMLLEYDLEDEYL
ncbi:hypothetical protein [Ekhidna sp.]|uniref:hypothetical protein n=1 Tax=Ekhidna sp. TaxID=2608089 RepID=UPI0035118D78